MRLLTDIPNSFVQMLLGHLSPGAYFQSVRRAKAEAVFSWDDPWPFAAEVSLLPYFVAKKMLHIKS